MVENFEVYTDNNPLTYVTSTARLDATGHRWVVELANYTFKIIYRSSKLNKDAEGLSRMIFPDTVKAVCQAAVTDRGKLPLAESLVVTNSIQLPGSEIDQDLGYSCLTQVDWVQEQGKDADVRRVIQFLSSSVKVVEKRLEGNGWRQSRLLSESY